MRHFLVAAGLIAGSLAAVGDTMPVAEQNALVQKYCAVCHNDARMFGGFSLEHFDAAHPDPSMAAMLVSKLKAQAIGAAGLPRPDAATQQAFQSALTEEAAGASEWTVKEEGPTLRASIVREQPSPTRSGPPDVYRFAITCRADVHEGEIKLGWAPGNPEEGRPMSVAVDGKAALTYKAEGGERQGNGKSGPGSVILPIALPTQTLTVSNVFPGETVVFPFGDLPQAARQELSKCFTGSNTRQ